jgi:hypothetical protein
MKMRIQQKAPPPAIRNAVSEFADRDPVSRGFGIATGPHNLASAPGAQRRCGLLFL